MTGKTKTTGFGLMIVTDRYKTLDIVTDGTIMIGTRMKEAATITTIFTIEITPPTIIGGERINRENMKIGADKDIGTPETHIFLLQRTTAQSGLKERHSGTISRHQRPSS